MRKLKAAILGYGRSGGSMHAGAMEATGEFQVVAVCDVDPARREQARERFGCSVYADHHEMLSAQRPELVSVVTRSDQHCPMACDCLAAGAAVLVTKPWCLNEGEARRMIAAAEASGRPLLPWLPARWGVVLRRLRELIAAGAIGRVFFVRRFQSSFATRDDWQTRREFGGGYLLNWGPHIVDSAVQVVGGTVRSAYGRLKHLVNPGDADDIFFAALTLTDGAVVTAEYSFAAQPLPEWYIQGEGGTILATGNDITVHSGPPSRPGDPTDYSRMAEAKVRVTTETVPGDAQGDSAEIYRAVAAAVRGEAPFPVTPASALELTRVLDAIRAADEENKVVTL